jgi:hypothetical protein
MEEKNATEIAAQQRKLYGREAVVSALVLGIIVTSVCSIFLEPVTDVARGAFLASLGWIGARFVDSTYTLAVRGPASVALIATFYWVLAAFASAIAFLAFGARRLHKRVLKFAAEIEGPDSPPSAQDITPTEPEEDLAELRRQERNLVIMTRWTWRAAAALFLFQAMFMSAEVIQVATAFRIRSSFELSMMAVDPVVTEAQRKALYADWALIKGRSDHERLTQKIKIIAANNKRELPL